MSRWSCSSLLLRGCFRDGFQTRQTFLKVFANHFLAVHEQPEHLAHEIIFPKHLPGNRGLVAFRFEDELGGVRGLEGLQELKIDADQLRRLALGDRHTPFTDLVVARPRKSGVLASNRTRKGVLARRIKLGPRRPVVPFVKIVHLLEHRRWWRSDGGRTRDFEFIRAANKDDEEQAGDDYECEKDRDHNFPFGFDFSSTGWRSFFAQPRADTMRARA